MPVDLRARMVMSDELRRAAERAPEIVADELTEGMQEVDVIREAVKSQIQQQRLVQRGDLVRTVRSTVYTNRDRGTVRGIVQVGSRGRGPAFYAAAQECGAILKPRKGEFMLIPQGEQVLITHVQTRSGDWRELSRPRMESLSGKFKRVRIARITPKWYFFRGTQRGLPHVEAALDRHGYLALQRIIEVGDAGGN